MLLDDDPALVDFVELLDPVLLEDAAVFRVAGRDVEPADLVFGAADPAFDAVALPADEVFDFIDPPARELELPDDLAEVVFFAEEPGDDLPVEREAAFAFTPEDEDFAFEAEDFDPPDFDDDDFAAADLEPEDFLVVAMIILRVFK